MSDTRDDVPPAIEVHLRARVRDIDGLPVRRTLPSGARRMVGPFIFFDHMGPVDIAPGAGVDVKPHPHIGLATITYLFDGELVHRDSVGSEVKIRPGDINWMVAGRGVAHSERFDPEVRARGSRLHGLQIWVALPREREAGDPGFEHHPRATLPRVERPGVQLRVLAGTAYGQRSPVGVASPTLYVHARLDDGAALEVDDEHEERAVYVVSGEVELAGETLGETDMAVLRPRAPATVRARGPAEVMLVGGAPLGEPRHIWWNFVSSDAARIEQAKADWRAGNFPKVFKDEVEFVPLPDDSPVTRARR